MIDGPLTNRFTITHKDGQPIDPNKRYFVLDMSDPDDREWAAFFAFIDTCRITGYDQLADDMDRYLTDVATRQANEWLAANPDFVAKLPEMTERVIAKVQAELAERRKAEANQ